MSVRLDEVRAEDGRGSKLSLHPFGFVCRQSKTKCKKTPYTTENGVADAADGTMGT